MARCQLSLAAAICAVLVANATGQTPQQVDLRALAVLSNALAATGSTAAQLPTDAVVTGEYVRISEGVEQTFPATFEIKGTRRFKMTSEAGMSLTLNDTQAVVQSSEEHGKSLLTALFPCDLCHFQCLLKSRQCRPQHSRFSI